MASGKSLSPYLRGQAQRIEQIARSHGLDFFETVFEMLDAKDVNAVAAYGGFPVRYPSWRFGMDYERLDKGHQWGLSKIYELVINNDPTYAYLVRTNSDMEQKLVMAHVFGHADFFKHNVWFQPTDRHMLDRMADNGTRVRRMIDLHGVDKVERFIDLALSLDNLVDPFLPLREYMKHRAPQTTRAEGAGRENATLAELCDNAAGRSGAEHRLPSCDVLGFLADKAPLAEWQRELVRIVRAEAYYFVPQRMTKIMNEGWASFWHSRMLTGGVLEPSEVVDFADCHSGATAASGGQLNPYKLGIELFRTAEERGLDIFRLRRIHNDASLIDALVDEEFARNNALFVYGKNSRTGRTEVTERDWRAVKDRLLLDLAWGGLPQIEIVDENYEGRGELLLVHRHDGRDLQLAHAGETLKNLAQLWGKPVHVLTQEEGAGRRITTDGDEVTSVETRAESGPKPIEAV
ncbi:MAG: SpoVR family protein [Planctomycetes bacterium]|nr:SpoVR family protein [Planctomycetota bacterium]